jgi:hypothetical protein
MEVLFSEIADLERFLPTVILNTVMYVFVATALASERKSLSESDSDSSRTQVPDLFRSESQEINFDFQVFITTILENLFHRNR